MSSNKAVKSGLVFVLMLGNLGTLACSRPIRSVSSVQSGALSASSNNSGAADTSAAIAPASNSAPLAVNSIVSDAAMMDCSRPDAKARTEITNADGAITLCAEYFVRDGRKNLCDSPSKFSAPAADWTYIAAEHKWVNETLLQNSPYMLPGAFIVVARDRNGVVTRGNLIAIDRPNNAMNCFVQGSTATSASSSGTSCAWSAIVIGPEEGPSAACTSANRGSTATNSRGTVFTCACR